MKTSILALAALLLAVVPASLGSVVVYDGTPGIVAQDGPWLLDSFGQVWYNAAEAWYRVVENDVPMPIEQIRFWSAEFLVTTDNELYRLGDATWLSLGVWPGAAAAGERSTTPAARSCVSPNPSRGSCRFSVRVSSPGPVSVDIVGMSGRIVRHLLDEANVAGDCSLLWDGKDDAGRDVPAGAYQARIESAEGVACERIVLVR
jgi:hypothetical protein